MSARRPASLLGDIGVSQPDTPGDNSQTRTPAEAPTKPSKARSPKGSGQRAKPAPTTSSGPMKRLTINVSPELHTKIKVYAAEHGTTLGQIVRDHLEELVE